jgi:hypothetical protein
MNSKLITIEIPADIVHMLNSIAAEEETQVKVLQAYIRSLLGLDYGIAVYDFKLWLERNEDELSDIIFDSKL